MEEIELHLEGLKNTIIIIGQNLNMDTLKTSIYKLQRVINEIEKIERAMAKDGIIHDIAEAYLNESSIFITEQKGASYEYRIK